jgi:hypothetical protein
MRKLNTPAKVQDFLNTLKFNFEHKGETLMSPLRVIKDKKAHCFEGALLGAYILSTHGHKPLVMHLEAALEDFDHVVTPFKVRGLWGALSKTNHAVLRYREPVYKSIRELAMSYFHEYFLNNGMKTMRAYSEPLNLNTLPKNWVISEKNLWYIDKKLDKVKHYNILQNVIMKNLRKADKIEIKAGEIVEQKKK